ncbi:hypothetical protein DL93DRAFT_2141230 [Clavulina sp. PMI_390]|nr:hypothetical protein DL93DRAFT_2141230 [Clavulina sp. PMI_390]
MTISEATYQPTHAGFGQVRFVEGEFRSSLIATNAFSKDDKTCHGTIWGPNTRDAPANSYDTLQYGIDQHCVLESDLHYLNHSCSPNTAVVLDSPNRAQWHIHVLKDINIGDEITIFYPSTEWESGQPFDCMCGSEACLERISGAKELDLKTIEKRGYVAKHIQQLLSQRDGMDVS